MTDYHPRGLWGTGETTTLSGVAADNHMAAQKITGLLLRFLDSAVFATLRHICTVIDHCGAPPHPHPPRPIKHTQLKPLHQLH